MNNLSEGQIDALIGLIDREISANIADGDSAFNTYWDNIRVVLEKAKK